MKPEIVKPNWYNLDHDAVNKKFEGELTYCGTFCVKNEYAPVAVYKSKKPNTKKGHKKYMLLVIERPQSIVRGMTAKEMMKWRFQDAIHCLKCNQVVYSVNRHDYRPCKCGSAFIDGGKDYTRSGGDRKVYKIVRIDIITGKILTK